MKLEKYFARIGFCGAARADEETLRALVRAHILSVPFENLDVQLGCSLTTNVDAAYEKIVERGRGGWCYELNGLLGWALAELGFDVTRIGGGVMREASGDDVLGNHLCLLVDCNGSNLVDVGFGGALTKPIRLQEGGHDDAPYRLGLKRMDDGFWRFSEDAGAGPFTYDFLPNAADENLLAGKCSFLQNDASSPFVQNLVAQSRRPDAHIVLRGRVLSNINQDGKITQIIQDPDELLACLRKTFNLDVPEIAALWPKICERHEAVFRVSETAAP
jgi:N-hydroxyarylamine O-acetyltransferase